MCLIETQMPLMNMNLTEICNACEITTDAFSHKLSKCDWNVSRVLSWGRTEQRPSRNNKESIVDSSLILWRIELLLGARWNVHQFYSMTSTAVYIVSLCRCQILTFQVVWVIFFVVASSLLALRIKTRLTFGERRLSADDYITVLAWVRYWYHQSIWRNSSFS